MLFLFTMKYLVLFSCGTLFPSKVTFSIHFLGADPKSVLCAFFKAGTCGKGNKCKFSHDLSLERKSEKRSIYVDEREQDKKG